MFPAKGCDIADQFRLDVGAADCQVIKGGLQITGVPENDSGDQQVHARRSVRLVFEAAVAHLAQPVEEDRPGQGVAGLPFVEAGIGAPAQGRITQPVERGDRPFHAPQFAQRQGETVLSGIGCQAAQHGRRGDGARPDGGGQTQQFGPMDRQMLQIDLPAHQGLEAGRSLVAGEEVELPVLQVADTGRETEAQ